MFPRINVFKISVLMSAIVLNVFLPAAFAATLSINFIAVNASAEPRKVPVRYNLPKELAAADVVDSGPLTIDYDVDRGMYYAFAEIDFGPKESKAFKLVVNDVWYIETGEIEILKKQVDANLLLVQDQQKKEAAAMARDQLAAQLDYILSKQASLSQDIERRIDEYRAYKDTLENIRNKAFSLDYLEKEAQSLQDVDEKKTIKLVVEVQNPSKTEERKVKQKHYLPKEILSDHVVDAQGFDVRYDNDKQKSFLTKEETFKPGESKKYEIIIRDIWNLPLSKVNTLQERADIAITEIRNSIYAESGEYLFARVQDRVDNIHNSRKTEETIKEHIGNFRVNTKRYEAAEKDIQKLEQMLAIVRAKKLEEMEKGKVKNILQKLKALRGLATLSEAIFKKGITVTATWRIIMGALAFVIIFTSWHFVTWMQRSKTMGEERGPKSGAAMKEIPKPGAETAAHK